MLNISQEQSTSRKWAQFMRPTVFLHEIHNLLVIADKDGPVTNMIVASYHSRQRTRKTVYHLFEAIMTSYLITDKLKHNIRTCTHNREQGTLTITSWRVL